MRQICSFSKILNNIFSKYSFLFLCLIVLYIISLLFTAIYPKKAEKYIKYHIEYSADRLLEQEGDWVFFFTKNLSSKTDNYADSLMLHITYCSDILPPLKSALAGAMYGDTYAESQLSQLAATSRGEPSGDLVYYSRYWHGYRIWLKPLLIFFDYFQIRLVNMYVFFMLLIICCIYLYRKVGWELSLALIITIISLNIVLIPMNLMFSCVFTISFIGCIAAVRTYNKHPFNSSLLFFGIGSITMFFDFYSYPFLTLGFPLICVLTIKMKDESTLKSMVKLSLLCISSWISGYFLTWFANVGLGCLVLGAQDTATTFDVVKYRLTINNFSSDLFSGIWKFLQQGFQAIKISLKELIISPHGHILGSVLGISLILFILFRNRSIRYKKLLGYLPISILPVLWYTIASKPTIQHVYFQYRGIGLWVMIVFVIIFNTIEVEKPKSKLKKL